MASFEAAYCLMTYTVARTDTWKGEDANLYQENAGSAVLWRQYPKDFVVMVDHGNSGDWTVVDELKQRPDEDELSKLLLPSAQQRQAALDSTRKALGGKAQTASGRGGSAGSAGGTGSAVDEGAAGGGKLVGGDRRAGLLRPKHAVHGSRHPSGTHARRQGVCGDRP